MTHPAPGVSGLDVAFEAQAPRFTRLALVVGVVGALATAAAVLLSDAERGRFFHAYLVAFVWCLSLALGGLFFVLVTLVMRAGWSISVRRVAEVLALGVVPLALAAVVLLPGMHELSSSSP
jgi:hypothetical protein